MKDKGNIEYRFKIDAFTPETLPMARLAEYMAQLASLLGEREHVHFWCLEAGSAVLVEQVEPQAAPKVRQRTESIRSHEPAADVLKAYQAINELLAMDNAVGELRSSSDNNVLPFPGREQLRELEYGPFTQDGSLDGVLIRIGGKDKTVHATIDAEGRTYSCELSRSLAKELAPYLFQGVLRLKGKGRWFRNSAGEWDMRRFTVESFSLLDQSRLIDVMRQLRDVKGSGWKTIEHQQDELKHLREG